MKKLMTLVAAGFLALTPVLAQAEDHAGHADVAVEAAADAVAPVEATLADGTKVSIEGDAVFVVDAEGNKTAAPDGVHTLSDGSTVTTAGGKVVAE